MAHKSHLGLLPDEDTTQCFEAGQVVKCTVIGPDSSGRGLRVSFAKGAGGDASGAAASDAAAKRKDKGKASAAGAGASAFAVGQVVKSCTVTSVNQSAGVLEVALPGGEEAVIESVHLADSPEVAKQLLEVMQAGTEIRGLLLLEHLSKRKAWRATRKPALLAAAAAGSFPAALGDLRKGALVSGFVANATAAGVFVRFCGRLTALAPLSQLGDGFVANPQELFAIGQSVRAQVLSVDEAADKAVVSLKAPAGHSEDGAPALAALLSDLRWLDELTAKKEGSARWAADFPPGSAVKGSVSEVKDYGLVVDLPAHPDVVGAHPPARRTPHPREAAASPPQLCVHSSLSSLPLTFPPAIPNMPPSPPQPSSLPTRLRAAASPRAPPSRRACSTSPRPPAWWTWGSARACSSPCPPPPRDPRRRAGRARRRRRRRGRARR